MTDPTNADLRRELAKTRDTLAACETHLARHAEANAALHCATNVMYSPLHARVVAAVRGIDHALERTGVPTLGTESPDGQWAALLADLDRCQHGRHDGDECSSGGDCTGTSAGNPHLIPGQVIGYNRYGDRIVMPDRDHKHDLANWRTGGAR
jgi:hypothetical protein